MVWAVAAGAALGGVARYYVTLAVQPHGGASFPWATLLINVTGSLLLGFLVSYAVASPGHSVALRAFLTTGFCGGYTTFSTYSLETVALLEEGRYGRAGAYALSSVLLAGLATWCGFLLARGLAPFPRRP